MPTYDYVCTKCDHELEAFHSMSAVPLKKCPACKKLGLKRQVGGGAGLIFKGTGFYITDYKKNSPGASESSGGGSGESKSEPKSGDAKPAAAAAK